MPPQGNGSGDDERRITYFATTHTRGKREMFGIRAVDRGKHVYVIGKTGMGKSTMLENMAIQDIQNGEGIAYIDPHGSTAEKLLDFIPYDRIKDVIYFAPFDTDHPIGFNVMEDVGFDKRHLVVSGLMGAFRRIWVDAWSARMEYILQNVLLALLEYPGSTLIDVNRMLTNKKFRTAVIEKITDPMVRSFWVDEFAGYTDRYTQEATPAIQNKVGQFVANPLIRNIVGQPYSSFDLRKVMDEKKIFIVNLSKGRMGETNASLLGSMLTVKIYLAAMSRADEPAARMARLPRCYFYVDEFQSMMNEAFADILSESRKYKLALTLANQYIEQMEENVRNAVFGNVGTLMTFRVGPFDAEVLKTVFEPTFEPEDLVNLGIGQIYLTLMIDGVGTQPFSAETIPPIDVPNISYREDVLIASRALYGKKRADVEAIVMQRQNEFMPDPPKPKEKREYGGGSSGGGGGGGGGGSGPRPQSSGGYQGSNPRDGNQNSAPRRDDRAAPPRDTRPPREFREPREQAQDPQAKDRPLRDRPLRDNREQLAPREVAPVRPLREIMPAVVETPKIVAKPADPRSALRAAISSATGGEAVKSPLERMRERKPQQEVRPEASEQAAQEPVPATPPPQQAESRERAQEKTQEKPIAEAPKKDVPPPQPEEPVGVSQELLEKILNGK